MSAAAAGLLFSVRCVAAQEAIQLAVLDRAAATRSFLDDRRRREDAIPTSAEEVAEILGRGLSPVEQRIMAFELVRGFPYRLSRWDPSQPDGLFALGAGDCRHKAAALRRLFRIWGYPAQPVQVVFDWRDLPIPDSILALLGETRSFHQSVEVGLDGRSIIVDATWDPFLGTQGFPVLSAWDGRGATLQLTKAATEVIRPSAYASFGELFQRYGIAWPSREKTLAFNRALNAWLDGLRGEGREGRT